MGGIKVNLPDKLEEEFREEVFKSKGMKKGNLSIAIEEAIKIWVDAQRQKRSEAAKKAWKTRKKQERGGENE